MNSAASAPTTSILPSVDASKMPQALRMARHSRATAACMSSPARGKYLARFQRPTFSNTAPLAVAHSCVGVVRTGSNKSPREMPAKLPKVTGV